MALVLACILAGPALAGAGAAGTAREAFLQEEITLAGSQKLYLVLDPARSTLTLRRRHVDLITLPVVAKVSRSPLAGVGALEWPAVCFELVSPLAEPARPRVPNGAGDSGDGQSPGGPQTVEAIQAVRDRFIQDLPARFQLSFEPGLEVIVSGESDPSGLAGRLRSAGRRLAGPWRTLADLVAGRGGNELELRLVMTPAEARRLFLALEPGVSLLVVP